MFHKKHSKYAERLRSLAGFDQLTPDQLERIADRATHLTAPAGWSLMSEGTPADKAYLILDGEVSVRMHGDEISRLGPGDTIGEVALVTHHLRSASVVSLSPLELLHFTAEAVADLSAEVPQFGRLLEQIAADRLARDRGTG